MPHRVVDSSKAKDKGGEAKAESGATKWREWKARQPVEEINVDPPADPGAVVQQKLKGKQKAQVAQKDRTPIIESSSEIEIVEYESKGKEKAKVKVNKAKVKANVEGVEGVWLEAKFIVPMLPTGKPAT